MSGPPAFPGAQNMPTMGVYSEDDRRLVAEAHAPRFTKNDVNVSINKSVLEITGAKHETEEDKGNGRDYVYRESHASVCSRHVLPEHTDKDGVGAVFDNGVLNVAIPFKELPRPKRVAISECKKK